MVIDQEKALRDARLLAKAPANLANQNLALAFLELLEQRPAPAPPTEAPRLWVVTQPSGEKHFLVREPLEGITEWAKGLDATVSEYTLRAVVHRPPPRKKKE